MTTTPTPHGAPELLPCPFCGVEPEIINTSVHCNNAYCEAQPFTAGQSKAEAITAWNRRAAIQQAAGAVPEGWKLVPVEPTVEMTRAAAMWLKNIHLMRAGDRTNALHDAYKAMLAASPSPLGREAGKEGSSDHLVPCAGGGVTQWQPIETAPEGELVIVGWLDDEDTKHPERHMFDYFEEGVWQNYFNEHEHYLIAGAARGRSEDAPYTHWASLAPIPAPRPAREDGHG